jgi:AcrR family transcriptional regulator
VSNSTPTRRRPTRAQKREANRERILSAARTVFGARGYHSATIEEIADEAGLSNGAIYYNFGSKEELFLALLDARLDERLEHTRQTLAAGASATGERAIDEEARDITRSFKESREWRLLLLEFVAYAARNPSFAVRFKDHKRRLRSAVAEILKLHLSARGITPPMPIDQLAMVVSGLANGLAVEELSDPGSVSDDLLSDVLTLLVSDREPALKNNLGGRRAGAETSPTT